MLATVLTLDIAPATVFMLLELDTALLILVALLCTLLTLDIEPPTELTLDIEPATVLILVASVSYTHLRAHET